MIVSFWSPFQGKGAVTTTTVLTAFTHFKEHDKDSNLITTICKDDSLKDMFEGRVDFTLTGGIDGIEQLLLATKLTPELFRAEAAVLSRNRIELLPWKKNTSDVNLLDHIYPYLSSMEEYNTVYFDLGGGSRDILRNKIFQKSSAIVVCIPQSTKDIHEVKKEIQSLKKECDKVLVVVTEYDSTCKLNIKSMGNSLGLSKNEIFYVPYINFIRDDSMSGDFTKVITRLESTPPKFIKEPIHRLKGELSRLIGVLFKRGAA